MSLFSKIFNKKDYVEIIDTGEEKEIQLCLDYIHKKKGNVKSLSVCNYIETEYISVNERDYDIMEQQFGGLISQINTFIHYSAKEKINIRSFLEEKRNKIVEKYNLEELDIKGFKKSYYPEFE